VNVSYEITKEDILNFNKYAMLNVPTFRRTFITNLVMLPLIILATGIILKFNIVNLILGVIGTTVVYYFLVMFLVKRKVMKMNAQKSGLLGSHTMEINPDGIKVKNANNEGFTSWKKIQNVVSAKNYIYFFITDQFAYIVPKRAFGEEANAQEFFKQAEGFWRKRNGMK
jgi:hypothetical protein